MILSGAVVSGIPTMVNPLTHAVLKTCRKHEFKKKQKVVGVARIKDQFRVAVFCVGMVHHVCSIRCRAVWGLGISSFNH